MPETNSLSIGALYIRVSTESQEELSPDAQKRLLLDYAKKNNILISGEHIFQDDGISGRKAEKRPAFQQMIALAKEKEKPFNVILVWKYSRFARNQEESIVYKSLLRKNGVEVISISEPLIDGVFGSLIERIIEWMDEYYSIRLSGEVFRGMSEAALRGRYLAKPPLGYRIERPKEPPVIVPEEAEIVRLIFDLYVKEGKSMFAIAKHLNALGFQTSHRKPFEKRSVEYILQNPSYAGTLRWNRTENESNRIKDKSEWILTEGNFPAIISKELYEAAAARFEQEYRPKGSRPVETHRHWLSGMLKCSVCGRSLATSIHTDQRYARTYTNFQCYGYSKGKCQVSHALSERKAVKNVLAGFEKLLAAESIPYEKKTAEIKNNTLSLIEEQLSRLAQKESRIRTAYENGIDTLEEYRESRTRIQAERTRLEKQLASSQESLSSPEEEEALLRRKIQNVYELLSNPDVETSLKSAAIRSVCEKIIYHKKTEEFQIFLYLSTL